MYMHLDSTTDCAWTSLHAPWAPVMRYIHYISHHHQAKGVLSSVYGLLGVQGATAAASLRIREDGMQCIDYSQNITNNLVAGVEAGGYDLNKGMIIKMAARYTVVCSCDDMYICTGTTLVLCIIQF